MASERDVRDPIARTYLKTGRRADGKTVVHARVYSPEYGLDRRGTGPTAKKAIAKALANVPLPR